jgi:hypothetical protein
MQTVIVHYVILPSVILPNGIMLKVMAPTEKGRMKNVFKGYDHKDHFFFTTEIPQKNVYEIPQKTFTKILRKS